MDEDNAVTVLIARSSPYDIPWPTGGLAWPVIT
jgi:hypothetical protein